MSPDSSLSPPTEDVNGSPEPVSVKASVNGKKRKAATPVKTNVTKRSRKVTSSEVVEANGGASAAASDENPPKTRGRKVKVEQETVKEEEVEETKGKTVVKTKAKTTRKKKEDKVVSHPFGSSP